MADNPQLTAKVLKDVEPLIREKRWAELVYYFRHLWNLYGWLYLKRNKNAVNRIKQEFTKLTRRTPYNKGTDEYYWDTQVAKYADRLGVAALIDDMRQAISKNRQVKTLIYFLHGKPVARWENLMIGKIEQEWQQKKQEHKNDMEELAKLLGFELKQVEPEWVIKARERYDFLQKKLLFRSQRSQRAEIVREMKKIVQNFVNSGYKLEKNR